MWELSTLGCWSVPNLAVLAVALTPLGLASLLAWAYRGADRG